MTKRDMSNNYQDPHGRREKILSYIFSHPDGCGRNDIAKNLGIPHATVSKYLDIFEDEKIIFRDEAKKGKKNLIFPEQIIADQKRLKEGFEALDEFKKLFPEMSQTQLKNSIPHFLFALSMLQMTAWTEYISGRNLKAFEITSQIVKRELDELTRTVYFNFAKSSEKASRKHYSYLNTAMNVIFSFLLRKSNLTTLGGLSKISAKDLNDASRLFQNFDEPIVYNDFLKEIHSLLPKGALNKSFLKLETKDTELGKMLEEKQSEFKNFQKSLESLSFLRDLLNQISDEEYEKRMNQGLPSRNDIPSRQEILKVLNLSLAESQKSRE